MPSVLPDFDNPGRIVTSPKTLAHVVLRTRKLQEMTHFYTTFLGAHVEFGNEKLSFITYDEEHHRIALAEYPDDSPKVLKSSGLEHVAFTYANLGDLLLAYRQRKEHGILPEMNVNHGVTTSFYYRDPDGNSLETQVDNFDSAAEATAFMKSKAFEKNQIGVKIDPEDLIQRMKNGESDEELMRYDATLAAPVIPGLNGEMDSSR